MEPRRRTQDRASEEENGDSPPRSHRETVAIHVDDDMIDPVEVKVDQLAQELLQSGNSMADEQFTTNLNMIAEALEEAETAFRKERIPPYRRDGHLIGSLLQVLDQHDEFYAMLEGKLSELTDNRVKAAACRLLLATVPVHSRFIVRLLYDEEILERMCEYSTHSDPTLRCYATGLLSIGLRDRTIADIVVNNDTPIKFLKRARLYASKLEKERQVAMKYIQENLRNAAARAMIKKNSLTSISTASSSGGSSVKTTSGLSGLAQRAAGLSLKRKHSSEGSVRNLTDGGVAETDTTINIEDGLNNVDNSLSSSIPISSNEDETSIPIVDGTIDPLPDPERHEQNLKRLVMLELLYTLDCIGSLGEYLELFAPALKEDIIGTIITFLHSKNPTVLSHIMKLTSHFLAHKKFCFLLIEAGGVELIFAATKLQQSTGQIGLLDRSLSMCLHGFASSSAVIEKIITTDPENLLSVAFSLLSSPNDRARQNAVVFFGLTLPFKAILDYFDKQNGLYTLLNIIRVGNHPKSSAQRQLAHDACLCLRQYLRVHMALVTHRLRRRLAQLNHVSNWPNSSATTPIMTAAAATSRLPARVPKLSSSKPIDVDDKAHEQNIIFYEKYRFSVTGANGHATNTWSAAAGPGGAMWLPAAKLNHLRGILVMLEILDTMCEVIQKGDVEDSTSPTRIWTFERAQFCLECFRTLTLVVPDLANEVCSTEVTADEGGSLKRSGMTILLEIAMVTNARDSDLVRDALRVFCNCVSPPHAEDCWQHPYKDIRQYTLTARSMRAWKDKQQGTTHVGTGSDATAVTGENNCCCSKAKDDKSLRPVRKLAREKNAIKVCVQLLRYKRSVQNADAIRLLATRALLGLSRDRHIAQILEKMQIGQLLSDLIRGDPVLEENADIHVRFREAALDLISQVTHRAPNAVINEATDPTVRKIEKASIVAQTKITYDENELLRLIHDHLMSKGLKHAASVLLEEANIDGDSRHLTCSSVQSPKMGAAVLFGKNLPERKNNLANNNHTGTDTSAFGSMMGNGTDVLQRPLKIPRLSSMGSVTPELKKHVDTMTPPGSGTSPLLTASSSSYNTKPSVTGSRTLSATPIHRRKHIKQALSSPHLFLENLQPETRGLSSSSLPNTALFPANSQKSPSIVRTGYNTPNNISTDNHTTTHSKLDEIITHYLREQHRQCSNPVTTVPPFKLLSDNDTVHHCPDPPTVSLMNMNICVRLMQRPQTGYRYQSRVFSNPYSDAGINRYVFSRYRPYRVMGAHTAADWSGVSIARFFGEDQQDIIMGNHDGELRRMNIENDSVVEEWTCHPASSAIVSLETNEETRMGRQNRLLMTGSVALTGFGTSEVALWDVNDMTTARWRLGDVFSALFNHYGDRIVALDARDTDIDTGVDERSNFGAVMIDIATGSVLCNLKDSVRSNDYGMETNCCFSPCDGTILTDGMLWDARIPTRAVYKFDKLSNVGYGYFHPSGNEVIVNSAVWDLRTYRLLRMVPALDKCNIKFNATSNILYAYYPYAGGDDLDRRRNKLKTYFRVLDARDYKDIATIELERPIFDLSIDTKSLLLSVVEGRYFDANSFNQDDSVCRLYEVGRKKPNEDDSDVEGGNDDSMDDDEYDDESEEEEDDENDDDDDDDELDDDEYDTDSLENDYDDTDDSVHILEYSGDESGDEESGDDEDQRSSRGSLTNRDIHFLFEIPEAGYYDMHDQYSSDEEEDAEDDE